MALRHLARKVGIPTLLRAAGPRFSPAAGARHLSFSSFQEWIRRIVFKEGSKCGDYRSREGCNPNNHQYANNQRCKRQDNRSWEGYNPNNHQYANQNYRSWEGYNPSNHQYANQSHVMSRHYSILGLDRSRAEPFSDAEIKNAFRRKALEYHPDHNKNNKEVAEAKFKEVMNSYEAIKSERQNRSC